MACNLWPRHPGTLFVHPFHKLWCSLEKQKVDNFSFLVSSMRDVVCSRQRRRTSIKDPVASRHPKTNISLFYRPGSRFTNLKLSYLSLWLALFQGKTLLEEKTVIVELGKSWPWGWIFSHKIRIEERVWFEVFWLFVSFILFKGFNGIYRQSPVRTPDIKTSK